MVLDYIAIEDDVIPKNNEVKLKQISVCNILGIPVFQQKIQNENEGILIKTAQWGEGAFLMQATLKNGQVEVFKLIVTH